MVEGGLAAHRGVRQQQGREHLGERGDLEDRVPADLAGALQVRGPIGDDARVRPAQDAHDNPGRAMLIRRAETDQSSDLGVTDGRQVRPVARRRLGDPRRRQGHRQREKPGGARGGKRVGCWSHRAFHSDSLVAMRGCVIRTAGGYPSTRQCHHSRRGMPTSSIPTVATTNRAPTGVGGRANAL